MDNKGKGLRTLLDFAENQDKGFSNIRRRCESCNEWVDGKPKYCPHCYGYTDLRKKRSDEEKRLMIERKRKEQKEFEAKPAITKFFIRFGQRIEGLYIAFVSCITAVMAALGG